MRYHVAVLLLSVGLSGCAVVAVTDAVVSVASTAVEAGASVVGTAVDVSTGAVKAVAGSSDED
ncbi:MAG: hypothetical protein H7839_14735 [Magnetococcus sp. YQC-5]